VTAEDILDRRTKHGLHRSASERDAFRRWLGGENVGGRSGMMRPAGSAAGEAGGSGG
jgi:hypothetical protein